jgi:hypothetical protein
LRVSDSYACLADKARWSHANGRNTSHISAADIDAARLFSYGYRSQSIGSFHATRLVVEELRAQDTNSVVESSLQEACTLLEQLGAKAVDPILSDHRALISTLYYYDRWTCRVEELLTRAAAQRPPSQIESARVLFIGAMEQITAGNGLYVARDLDLPAQGAFVVPGLGISIVPIIYGDYHSWNAAFLAGDLPGVSVHRHREGVEIHLGHAPVEGHTILGSNFTTVREGYAMPIPPMTDHGFLNISGHDHVVPFVFGSLRLGGWGIFFDVEPRPNGQTSRTEQALESLNHSVWLDRVIQEIRDRPGSTRDVLVPAALTGTRETGGLELGITCTDKAIDQPPIRDYRIVSVQSGSATIQIADAVTKVGPHDHFGVPSQMTCRLTPDGTEPVVFLDCTILPVD